MTISKNVQLPRSSKKGVKPKADELNYGNLAVNFCAGEEFLSTKNSNNEVVIFPSENYISKHPITVNNLTANGDANISGDTTIKGNLNVSGTTKTTGPNYFDGQTYVKSGTSFVTIADFVSTTAHADGNDYITGGTATENTLHLTGKGSASANITGVVTTDKVEESVKAHSLWEKGTGNNSAKLKGNNGKSDGNFSVSEGNGANAIGVASHAEGGDTVASGDCSHAEGESTTAIGTSSHVEGENTTARGEAAHAEGVNTSAVGSFSHAEGNHTKASGESAHSEGKDTTANGDWSHAEGSKTQSNGNFSHAEGYKTNADGGMSHAEGGILTIHNIPPTLVQKIDDNFTFTRTSDNNSFIYDTDFADSIIMTAKDRIFGIITNKDKSKIINIVGKTDTTLTFNKELRVKSDNTLEGEWYYWSDDNLNKTCVSHGLNSHVENAGSLAFGNCSHAEGTITVASGHSSHAEGVETNAVSDFSHAEGSGTTASGVCSHAEGSSTTASGESAHAEGETTNAIGNNSHSEGRGTTASGISSHAEGEQAKAIGDYSHSEGRGSIANNEAEHACGKFNKTNTNQIFSIGIGGSDTDRKNAISVNTDGVISSDVVLINGATSMTGLKISGGVESTSGMIAPTYLNSSDERLKKNIVDISSDDINKVKNVELKSFEFKSDNSKHFGVIAQNVENVGLSDLVATDVNGIKYVDYMSLLILKIAELESEIKDLKKQINK